MKIEFNEIHFKTIWKKVVDPICLMKCILNCWKSMKGCSYKDDKYYFGISETMSKVAALVVFFFFLEPKAVELRREEKDLI